MDIKFDKTGNVTAELTITIVKADYEERVNAALKDFRKKASMPGFRPGQAPMGMLKKRFGTEITAEQVNKLLGEQLYGYIRDNNINILGEPLPNEEKQQDIDFNTMDSFSFVFDVAMAPEFDAKLTAKDKVDYYNITVDDAMVDQQIQMYTSRAGEYKKVDEYQPKDMVKGLLSELDAEGNPLEGGVQVEGAVMLPDYMKNEDEKAKFAGAKTSDVITFSPFAAYEGNEAELSSLLKIQKEEVASKTGNFTFQISEITRYEAAALTQGLFDQVMGEGVCKNEEEFRAKVQEQLSAQFEADSEFRFMVDLRQYLTGRIGEVEFPDALLKRVMRLNNPDKDEKYVEDNYEGSIKELTWHLIKEQLADQFEVKINQDDVLETAKQVTKIQFAQYGMTNVPEEVLTNYANEMLKNKQQAEGLVTRAVENKIAAAAKGLVKLNEKKVTLDEFNKLFAAQ